MKSRRHTFPIVMLDDTIHTFPIVMLHDTIPKFFLCFNACIRSSIGNYNQNFSQILNGPFYQLFSESE